ncbi:hypothetical protein SynA1825c_02366 [Synechococcus sp. A18-25c]|nr:hypothetical protein SynA1825c_02366 [Synechococcus sp. A18-25c]
MKTSLSMHTQSQRSTANLMISVTRFCDLGHRVGFDAS